MQLPDDICAALDKLCAEWNSAERAIKIAEQVNGEIINPSIYELRYGGRRIIEAFELMRDGRFEEAGSILKDAHFDCCRARHDAIDAATTKMTSDLDIALKKLGATPIIQAFPDYSNLVGMLVETRQKIAVSRENRDDRDAIYKSIVNDNLVTIAQKFNMFQANEDVIIAHARSERRKLFFGYGLAAAGVVVAIATLFWTVVS